MVQSALNAVFGSEFGSITAGAGHWADVFGFDDDGVVAGHGMNLEPRTDEFYLSFGHGDLLFYPTAL
jgi:hypothetical protein